MDWYLYGVVFLVAATVTFVLTPYAIKAAKHYGIVDLPGENRVNTKPVPRFGGTSLFLGVMFSLATLVVIFTAMPQALSNLKVMPNINYVGIFFAISLVFLVGLFDDLFSLKARSKLIIETIAACIACASGIVLSEFTNPLSGEVISLGLLAWPITVAYLLCFINIINIIDGLDGLACGVVMISAATIGIISLQKGAFEAALLTTAILGSCLAFLRYNVHPARIFMGDSGALFLGFLLGLASLDGVVRTPALISVLVPIVAAGIPVLDAAMAIIRRFRAKQSIMERDAGHIHHRLVDSGMSHRTTVLVILLLSAFLALCALLFATYTDFVIRIVIVVALVIFIPILVWRLRLVQPALQHVYHPRPKKELPQGTNRISASIVTYNSESKIVPLLRSMQRLLDTTRLDVFVIDNASADNTVAEVKNNAPWATVITNEYNRGFGAGHNQVLSVLQSKYHVVINPDIELIEDSISELASFMDKNPEVVMVVPKVLNPDGSEQKLPKLQPEPRYLLARRLEGKSERADLLVAEYTRSEEEFTEPELIEHASGSFFMIQTGAFKELKGFDERFFLYFEDNDLSLRASKLGDIMFYPGTSVVHGYAREARSKPFAFIAQIRSMFRFFGKYGW